jgi:hypothetical protein
MRKGDKGEQDKQVDEGRNAHVSADQAKQYGQCFFIDDLTQGDCRVV